MGLMIGDNRECAKAVTDLLLEAKRPSEKKLVDRQIDATRTAYIFGHYDSRGGAALVLARNHIEALKKYAMSFFDTDFDDPTQDQEYLDGMIDTAQEDFLKKVQLVVCDETLPVLEEGVDLDIGFNVDGYVYGHIDSRYEKADYDHQNRDAEGRPAKIHTGDFSDWNETDVFVLWKPLKDENGEVDWVAYNEAEKDTVALNAPSVTMEAGVLEYQFRIVREELGEDACGLCLIV